jgi:hypothetical protein
MIRLSVTGASLASVSTRLPRSGGNVPGVRVSAFPKADDQQVAASCTVGAVGQPAFANAALPHVIQRAPYVLSTQADEDFRFMLRTYLEALRMKSVVGYVPG